MLWNQTTLSKGNSHMRKHIDKGVRFIFCLRIVLVRALRRKVLSLTSGMLWNKTTLLQPSVYGRSARTESSSTDSRLMDSRLADIRLTERHLTDSRCIHSSSRWMRPTTAKETGSCAKLRRRHERAGGWPPMFTYFIKNNSGKQDRETP